MHHVAIFAQDGCPFDFSHEGISMSESKLVALLNKGIVVGDGAMGTMLYDKGIFLNSCFDELNLSKADLIKNIHKAYVEAGADFIETNTFGANEIKLARFGLAEKTQQINTSAAEIARQCAGNSTLVAGSIGPLSSKTVVYTDQSRELAHKAFKNQALALAKAGVDFFILETFSSSEELLIAIEAVRGITELPLIAQMTVNQDNLTTYGEPIESAIVKIAAQDVIAVGLNCSVGPADMLNSLELISKLTDKPISVQPNAGLPRQVENRTLYMCTPEYMAEYAKKFFEKGAKIIGGCCGTTPEHISQIARAVKPLGKAHSFKRIVSATEGKSYPASDMVQLPLEQKSKIGAKLARGEKITTIEITPPMGIDMSSIIEKARLCEEMGIDAINIPDGPRASSRLSPVITAALIQQQSKIETIVHFCCRDRNLIAMQSDMLGASAIGLKNMLIITGDPPKLGQYPNATGVFDADSIALTSVLKGLNCGLDIGGSRFSPGVCITIGVGANPAATDLSHEIDRFKQKVQAGAEYAITQPVFDIKMMMNFLEKIEPFKIPIVAGIWPFTSFKNAEFMANEVPGVVVPDELLQRMSQAKTKQQGIATGIEIAREMIAEITDHVQGFAVSAPFGNVRIALSALEKIEIDKI